MDEALMAAIREHLESVVGPENVRADVVPENEGGLTVWTKRTGTLHVVFTDDRVDFKAPSRGPLKPMKCFALASPYFFDEIDRLLN